MDLFENEATDRQVCAAIKAFRNAKASTKYDASKDHAGSTRVLVLAIDDAEMLAKPCIFSGTPLLELREAMKEANYQIRDNNNRRHGL